jgi:hypothetical protein
MKKAIALLSLSLFCTLGPLFAADSSVSVETLPPRTYALAKAREGGKSGTTDFYNLPRKPVTAMAIFSSKEAAEAFIAKLTVTQARKLTPFALEKSFLRSILKMRRDAAILLDPVNENDGGISLVEGASVSILNPNLRNELLERGKRDQEIRFEVIRHGNEHAPADLLERCNIIDKENRERMKEIIHQYGWPSPELVGEDATQIAWLLVQHADLEFQKQCLPLVKEAYLAGKLPGGDYALLQDRVLVGDGTPQIYGSQALSVDQWKNGQPAIQPIEDERNVDKRRAEVGLQPLADYIESMKALYLPPSDAGSTGAGDRTGSESQRGKADASAGPSQVSK